MICACGPQGLAPRPFLPSPSISTTCLTSFIATHNSASSGAKPADWHALCYEVRYAIGNGAGDVRGRGTPSASAKWRQDVYAPHRETTGGEKAYDYSPVSSLARSHALYAGVRVFRLPCRGRSV